MSEYISARIRDVVVRRAGGRCEYCLILEDDAMFPHEPDHIIAVKHGGQTLADNLAWACFVCNRFKGSDLASIDPATENIVPLFHPRRDVWREHFRLLATGEIVGKTEQGRVTVFLLRMNLAENVEFRKQLFRTGRFPHQSE